MWYNLIVGCVIMNIEFKINEFSGPLDLLLHLIKESKMDIMNIEIEEITKQYMDYLALQEKMNLEIASEYLVMASSPKHVFFLSPGKISTCFE